MAKKDDGIAQEMDQMSEENLAALASLVPSVMDQDMREIGSYEDALKLAEQIHGTVDSIADELGTGFSILEDKTKLVGQKFVIITFRVNPKGDFGAFVSVALVTDKGGKYIINDGSSGIMKQLLEYAQAKKKFGAMEVPRGLRVSDYPTCAACDRPHPVGEKTCANCGAMSPDRHKGTSFYLDTGADDSNN